MYFMSMSIIMEMDNVTAIQDAQSMGNTGIISCTPNKQLSNPKAYANTDDYYQDIMNRVASKMKENGHWFDVPFCHYFFENIKDYASIAYYYDNHLYDKALTFNQKTFKDCKLNYIIVRIQHTMEKQNSKQH